MINESLITDDIRAETLERNELILILKILMWRDQDTH